VTVHVWCARLGDFPAAPALAILTPAERERARRYVHEADRLRCLYGRAAMRLALGQHLGTNPATIPLSLEDNRPPRILDTCNTGISLSHSGDWIMVGLREGPVGVDVEQRRPLPDLVELARSVFHPAEMEIVLTARGDARQQAFFALWSAKEAYLKGIGMGLGREPAEIAVPLAGGRVCDPQVEQAWFVQPVTIADDHAAAVAAPEPTFAVARHALF
jgi:4'-phosphopantetheinyl transferase